MKKLILIIIGLILVSCQDNYTNQDQLDFINLKWHQAYNEDSIDKAIIGLQWALSYVGANTPCNSSAISTSGSIVTLKLTKLGFSKEALLILKKLTKKTKSSEAYKKTNSVDLGRFITLILGSPEHYYALIETPKTLTELKSNYELNKVKGYVNNSSVGFQDRILQFSDKKPFKQLFISEERDSTTKFIYEYETIELLKNGQLRFGIYDEKGQLKNVANKKHTRAGKPAKCIWCHESNLNQLFKVQENVFGFLTQDELQEKIIKSRDSFHLERLYQKNNIDYSKTQQHTFTELLYISFLEPSANRLCLEWNMPKEEVLAILKDIKTHRHSEFDFLGNIYYRKDIEKFAPLKAIEVSKNVRELSTKEVNYLND